MIPERRTILIWTNRRAATVSGHAHPKAGNGFDVHQLGGDVIVLKVPGYQVWDRSNKRSKHVAGNYEVWRIVAAKQHAKQLDPEHPTIVCACDLMQRFPIDRAGPFSWSTVTMTDDHGFTAAVEAVHGS